MKLQLQNTIRSSLIPLGRRPRLLQQKGLLINLPVSGLSVHSVRNGPSRQLVGKLLWEKLTPSSRLRTGGQSAWSPSDANSCHLSRVWGFDGPMDRSRADLLQSRAPPQRLAAVDACLRSDDEGASYEIREVMKAASSNGPRLLPILARVHRLLMAG